MITTHTEIGELDVVALIRPVEHWPAGTEGTVQVDNGRFKLVEIDGIENSEDDILDYMPTVAIEDLRLVWKCPPPKARTAGD